MIRSKRQWFSRILGGFWLTLFIVGVYQVFLFLHGYPPFVIGKSEPVPSGYATFSSYGELFLDDVHLGTGEIYDRYEVGEYRLCAEKLSLGVRCRRVEVLPNDQLSTEVKDIILFSPEIQGRVFLGRGDIFEVPNGEGVVWYDDLKRQVFFVRADGDGVESIVLEDEFEGFVWNDDTKEISMKKDGSGVKISFEKEGFMFFDSLPPYRASGGGVFQEMIPQSLFESAHEDLVGSLDRVPLQVLYLGMQGNMLLVFDYGIFLFGSDSEDFRLIAQKDAGTKVLYQKKSRMLFFVQDGALWRIVLEYAFPF